MTTKTSGIISVLALILALGAVVTATTNKVKSDPLSYGAVGSQLIEQYSPYVLYNGGINSALPVTTSDTLTGAAGAFTGDLTVSGGTVNVTTTNTATSTIIGGCFQFYATSTATAQKFQASTTPGVMYSQYGTCPNL